MGDGANIGVTAGRALKTILGGEESPTEEEQTTPEQVKERVMAMPDPCTGEPIHDREGIEDAYSFATDCVAKAMLLCEEADPGLLMRDPGSHTYPDDYSVPELRGKTFKNDACDIAWEAIKSHWPDFDDWIGGATGFMVGFAFNTARYVNEIPPTPNPAIMTIGGGNE